jgi:membrane-associated phospholipid phosphatase
MGGAKGVVYPVDWIVASYNAILAMVWLGLASRVAGAPWLALAHAAAAGLPWLLRGLPRVPPRARALRDSYSLIGLALFWAELGPLQALRGAEPRDLFVEQLDLALFGVHWHEIWMSVMPGRWMSEAMHFTYFLYYLLLVIPPLAIGFRRGLGAFRSVVLALMITYLSCFLFYLVFPVYGPRAIGAASLAAAPDGLFHTLVERARASGDSLGTAFPSSHVAGAATIAWVGWRWLSRKWSAVLTLAALAVALATVYTRNHYAVDALAGLLWIVPLQGWLVPALERLGPDRDDDRSWARRASARDVGGERDGGPVS